MSWSAGDIISFLYIAVAVMLLIVLYHVLFIVVDVRKITRRFENITNQVEDLLLKPLAMTDQIVSMVMGFIEEKSSKHKKK